MMQYYWRKMKGSLKGQLKACKKKRISIAAETKNARTKKEQNRNTEEENVKENLQRKKDRRWIENSNK